MSTRCIVVSRRLTSRCRISRRALEKSSEHPDKDEDVRIAAVPGDPGRYRDTPGRGVVSIINVNAEDNAVRDNDSRRQRGGGCSDSRLTCKMRESGRAFECCERSR